jgi:hypothetical protein
VARDSTKWSQRLVPHGRGWLGTALHALGVRGILRALLEYLDARSQAESRDKVAIPSPESARRSWAAAEAEDAFWRDHYPAYLKAYPDLFVAASKDHGRVVAADSDLLRLVGLVRGRGLDMQRVWVRFMAATPISLAL